MPSDKQPYSILVAVQDDPASDEAIGEAFRVAAAHSVTELHALHVIRARPANADRAVAKLDKRLAEAPAKLEKILMRAAPKDSDMRVIGHVRAGDEPAHTILQAATDLTADMVVLGTHRRRGLEKLLLGSVAEKVLRNAHCPVLVVVPKDYEGEALSPSITPPCPTCLTVRKQTEGKTFWCERHQRDYQHPHIYVPSDPGRNSILTTH